MDLGLAGKVALVTGGSKGIGRATAECFAHEGARVAVTFSADREAATRVTDDINRAGGEAMAVPMQLGSLQSVRAAIGAVLDRWDRVDILVNNAVSWGLRAPDDAPPFEVLRPVEWQGGLRTNVEGVYAAVQTVVPSMRQHRWGRIVNISSGFTRRGVMGAAWYTTAKTALHGLTRALATELGPAGILVNVVMPGLTITEHIDRVPADTQARVREDTPIGRLLGPADIASTILYLCSESNTGITGEVIGVTGGWR